MSSQIGNTFHFLPVVTAGSNSRRDIELRQSSARSHLAKSMHRRRKTDPKKDKTNDIIENDTESESLAQSIVDKQARRHTGHLPVTQQQLALHIIIPDKVVDQHTKMLLHYCKTSYWPGFELGSASFHIPAFALSYNSLIAQGPALVHALLWQAAVSLNFQRKSTVEDKKSLMHYNQALSHISRDITKPITEIPEQTMYAILSLCGPEISHQDGNGITTRAFNPPLTELSWIHAYGCRALVETHAKALMRLVDLKGGVHNLRTPGFQASFNYLDLVRATQKLVKPHLPICQLYGQIKQDHDRAQFFGHIADFTGESSFGDCSAQIYNLSEIGLSEEIKQVMCDMSIWVRVIEAYHHETLSNPDSSLIAAHRDLIQQRLLGTLPSRYSDERNAMEEQFEELEDNIDTCINELVQTALMIFSLGVTFPITYAAPYHRAAERLKGGMQRRMQQLMDLELHDLLIWLGMLGVLCTEQVADDLRAWFIDILFSVEQDRTRQFTSRDWNRIKEESLDPFLWSSVACDNAAERAWDQIQQRLRARSWDTIAWPCMLGTMCG
ncbi:hypothetical protein FSARC_10556 [Fusarium sarcochroum]|uniref:Uncharacterized protein n=1 Tax=Fusarium sarcochroum TaxID=1208366 RepID=A0A8H4X3W6_9HYPO|nr:hypothetical protein FSARC_10556 [Fusarium sarcochroum]